MKYVSLAPLSALLAAALIVSADAGAAMAQDTRTATGVSAWTPKERVRAFYSGHSLSDGIPDIVDQIARSLGHRLDFEVQSIGYSLLRVRTKGGNTAASDWPGYSLGNNRKGSGLNVAEELRQPKRLGAGDKYDVLVVTERHDLPNIARQERTAHYLADFAKHVLAGNPDGEVLLYHTWLGLDTKAPWPWIDYERAVAPMWECLASRANRDLPMRGNTPRVRVIPGGSALAELAAELWDGKVPGITLDDPGERVKMLFFDQVHLSYFGAYYIGLVHYAVLFGRSPEGAAIPDGISKEAGRHMQTLAAKFIASYGERANASAGRDMESCRALMADTVCPAFVAYHQGSRVPLLQAIKLKVDTYYCRRDYTVPKDPANPFADPKE